MKKKYKILIAAFLAVIIVTLAVFAIGIYTRRGSEKAAGIYFASGGESYISISPASLNRLRVDNHFFRSTVPRYYWNLPESESVNAVYSQNTLTITGEKVLTDGSKYDFDFVLTPSEEIKGDWDLEDCRLKFCVGGASFLLKSRYWKKLFSSLIIWDIKQLKKDFSLVTNPRIMINLVPPPDWRPIKSFLHRIDNPGLPDYFTSRLKAEGSSSLLDFTEKLMKDHPGDPWCALHRIEMEAEYGDVDKALEMLEEWKPKFRDCENIILNQTSRIIELRVYDAKVFVSNPGLKKFRTIFKDHKSSSQKTLPEKIQWFKKISTTDYMMADILPLVPPVLNPSSFCTLSPLINVPNFLEVQISAKCASVLSAFSLLKGNMNFALQILSGCYRTGQIFNASGSLISRLIGIAVRNIVIQELENICLNTRDSGEMKTFRDALDHLHNTPGQETGETLSLGEMPPIASVLKDKSSMSPDYTRALVRHKTSDAKFQILRTAAAARQKFLDDQSFPRSENEFDEIIPGGLPNDPFSENEKLKFKYPPDNDYTIYSLGPDETDDSAATIYDPTNGTDSPGDIIIRIPEKRRYPFSEKPVRAANAEELLEQFPNGLPRDIFSADHNRPLSIIDSMESSPVKIFSFGPDKDEEEYLRNMPKKERELKTGTQLIFSRKSAAEKNNAKFQPDPVYDPTNGTISNGDLYIEIPE